ncbi:hypothetical protein RCL1_002761 [Eukaryota sp. TZLM3-RCL]
MQFGRSLLYRMVFVYLESLHHHDHKFPKSTHCFSTEITSDILLNEILLLLCRMGKVSTLFRCTTLEAIGHFFKVHNFPLLSISQALYLQKYLSTSHPNLSLHLIIDVNLDQFLPISATALSLYSNTNIDHQPLVSFLNNNNLTTVKHLTLSRALGEFVEHLSGISSLESFTIENEYPPDSIVFKSNFSNLKKLSLRFLSLTYEKFYFNMQSNVRGLHCDVSCLVSLCEFCVHSE